MKLVLSIVHRDDADQVIQALIEAEFRSTTLSTTGGFLREGNATILVGTEEEKVPAALDIIKANTRQRTQNVPALLRILLPQSKEVVIGAATVFVLDLEQLLHF